MPPRAIAIQLALAGTREIHLINRTCARALRLAEEIEERIGVFARGYDWTAQDLDRIIASSSSPRQCHRLWHGR